MNDPISVLLATERSRSVARSALPLAPILCDGRLPRLRALFARTQGWRRARP